MNEAGVNDITGDKAIGNDITGNEASASKSVRSETLETETSLPNFRQGDAIILYERNRDTDNVTNKMVFKGNIEYLTENEIGIRLRATQQNPSVLPAESLYAIEHDTMDTTCLLYTSVNRNGRWTDLNLLLPG